MDEKKAMEILGEYIDDDELCTYTGRYIQSDEDKVDLEGKFSADELEAMAWWLRKESKNDC